MAKIRFLAAYLLWARGETVEFSEPGATELVVSGIAEYLDAPQPDAAPERPAVSIAPSALPSAALPKPRTNGARTTRKRK